MKKRDSATHRGLLWALCALTFVGPALQVQAQGGRSNYIPRTERGRLAEQIVLRWSVQGAKQLDTTPRGWAGAMGSAFAQAPIEQLRRAASAASFDQLKDSFHSASIGALATGDLVFHSIIPCRIVNTREYLSGAEPLLANTTRTILGQINDTSALTFGDQGGHRSKCGIPQHATVLALQILAARPEGDGHLTVFPSGTMPTASSLNYRPGENISNELPVKLAAGTPYAFTKSFQVFANQKTHFVADVVGYYAPLVLPAPPPPQVLKCVQLDPAEIYIREYSKETLAPPACASGYVRTSIQCWTNAALVSGARARLDDCEFMDLDPTDNYDDVNMWGYASATCCKI